MLAILMSRTANVSTTQQLRISTTNAVVSLLDQIAATGLYGKNRAEVAEEMLREKIREAVRNGLLSSKPKKRR